MNQLRDGFNDSFIKTVAASEYASGGQKTVLVCIQGFHNSK